MPLEIRASDNTLLFNPERSPAMLFFRDELLELGYISKHDNEIDQLMYNVLKVQVNQAARYTSKVLSDKLKQFSA